jgi:hypothetical protein
MMPGRTDRTERVVGLFGDDRIDRGDDCTGGPQRRCPRSGGKDRVGVDADVAGTRNRPQHTLNVPSRVNAQQVVDARFWRLPPLQPSKFWPAQRSEYGTQPRRRFRMVPAGVVFETGGVGIEAACQRDSSQQYGPARAARVETSGDNHTQPA